MRERHPGDCFVTNLMHFLFKTSVHVKMLIKMKSKHSKNKTFQRHFLTLSTSVILANFSRFQGLCSGERGIIWLSTSSQIALNVTLTVDEGKDAELKWPTQTYLITDRAEAKCKLLAAEVSYSFWNRTPLFVWFCIGKLEIHELRKLGIKISERSHEIFGFLWMITLKLIFNS